ncbi:MAG TPA: hypothetical protein VF278_18925 [Pirellulales bacterium]
MTITNVGSTKRYSEGWENIFRGKKATKTSQPAAQQKSPTKKKARKK